MTTAEVLATVQAEQALRANMTVSWDRAAWAASLHREAAAVNVLPSCSDLNDWSESATDLLCYLTVHASDSLAERAERLEGRA